MCLLIVPIMVEMEGEVLGESRADEEKVNSQEYGENFSNGWRF